MKGILFTKIGFRYMIGIIHRNDFYHIFFRPSRKGVSWLVGFNTYKESGHLVLKENGYFLGLIKL